MSRAASGGAVDVSGGAERDDTLSADSRYLSLFPFFAFGIYLPDQVGVHLNTPVAPNRTRQRRAMYSLGRDPVMGRRHGAAREALA